MASPSIDSASCYVNSKGVLPVAILGTHDFNVTEADIVAAIEKRLKGERDD